MFLEVFNIKDTNGRKEVYNERMKQLNKLTVINEIDDLLETYCEGCFIKRELKINGGKTMAHRFCINSCTVGDQLQFLGQELNKVKTK